MNGRAAKAARRVETARIAALEAAIEQVWARIPDAGCKGLCQSCCGPIAMSEVERARIARRHGLVIQDAETKPGTLECPALGVDGGCTVYQDRPTLCRLYASCEALPCEHGCGPTAGLLTDADAATILAAARDLDGPGQPPPGTVRAIANDPIAGPLFARALRGDRSVYPALADAVGPILTGGHR